MWKEREKVQASTSRAHDFDNDGMDYISMLSFSFWCLMWKRESNFQAFINIIHVYIYVWDK
jgi:hypothetical protein